MMVPRSQRGFTLLELLVALGLLALITASIAGSLTFGRRVWERGARVEAEERRGASLRALRGLLERAELYPEGPGTPAGTIPMRGTASELSFVSVLPELEGHAGRQVRVRLRAEPDAAGFERLTLALEPMDETELLREPRVLLERTGPIRFRYLGTPPGRFEKKWADSWTDRPYLPALITIDLGKADSAPAALHVAPRLGG